MYESLIVIGSEAALSLYPILIKTVSTNLTTQLLSRFLTFTVLAAVLATPKDLLGTWGNWKGATRSASLGLVTLAHVAVSYFAFKELPAGVAMSLFYTYPIWNLLGGVLGFGESVSPFQLVLTAVAFLGVVLVSFGSRQEGDDRPIRWKGIAAALAAAVTETIMYFAVRTAKVPDPYYATLELYPGALFGLAALLGLKGNVTSVVDTRPSVWLPMILFNTIVGFIGYNMRFYAIPKVSTATFSILSFVGVVASFLFGWIFAGERPSWMATAGAALITAASGLGGRT
jgi:drug/metabolite transporter (DMT)-like permease